MRAIVYDTGALLAAERRNPDFLALHDEITAARIRPIIPVVVVLAQAWRGGPQHPDLPAQRLRRTPGRPMRRPRRRPRLRRLAYRDVVDTIIVITTAVRHQARAVTGDPGDLTRIADCIGVKIRIFAT